jgi:hypothetical protein
MNNMTDKSTGPASPLIFYTLVVLALLAVATFLVHDNFREVKIAKNIIACADKERLDPGSHWVLKTTKIDRINLSGTLKFDEVIKRRRKQYTIGDLEYTIDSGNYWTEQICWAGLTEETIRSSLKEKVIKISRYRIKKVRGIIGFRIDQYNWPNWVRFSEDMIEIIELEKTD